MGNVFIQVVWIGNANKQGTAVRFQSQKYKDVCL